MMVLRVSITAETRTLLRGDVFRYITRHTLSYSKFHETSASSSVNNGFRHSPSTMTFSSYADVGSAEAVRIEQDIRKVWWAFDSGAGNPLARP